MELREYTDFNQEEILSLLHNLFFFFRQSNHGNLFILDKFRHYTDLRIFCFLFFTSGQQTDGFFF